MNYFDESNTGRRSEEYKKNLEEAKQVIKRMAPRVSKHRFLFEEFAEETAQRQGALIIPLTKNILEIELLLKQIAK